MNRIFRVVLIVSSFAVAAAAQTSPSSHADSKSDQSKPAQSSPAKADRATAYYHYTLAHMYEEQVTIYGRSELANKAMEEYRLAIESDPSSEFLTSALAELYVKTGRIRDAVLEAQDIIKRDPSNLEAHKLLGRIYLRSLGDMPGGGNGSDNVLKLAIEQYEMIVKIEPNNVDDHLLLGRLYRLNNDLQKAESELKTAVKLDPDSEEAVTTLALLYTDEGDTAHALQVLSAVPDAGRSAKLYAALGATYEQRKDYKSAIDAYKHAIQLDRDKVKAFGGQVILSIDHEMNGNWETWGYEHQSPAAFVAAWRHVVTIFRKQGARNVTWLWTVNITDRQNDVTEPAPWWPGSSYVNWVGIDGYYYSPSTVFSSLFGATIADVRELTHDPILIAETGAAISADQSAKIGDLFLGVRTFGLLGFVLFDQDGVHETQSWRISSPAAYAALRQDAEAYMKPPS